MKKIEIEKRQEYVNDVPGNVIYMLDRVDYDSTKDEERLISSQNFSPEELKELKRQLNELDLPTSN